MSAPASSAAPLPAFSRRISLIVAATFFMETLDSTIVTTALPVIAASFNTTTLSLSISAYLLALAPEFDTKSPFEAIFCGQRNVNQALSNGFLNLL